MKVNQRSIKISGAKVEIPTKPNKYDLEVTVKGDITKTEYYDNQDGTHDVVYTLKPIEVIYD